MANEQRIELDLSDDERSYLAMHARYASSRQEDGRYWDKDPAERERLLRRWLQIANALHPEPWGPGSRRDG